MTENEQKEIDILVDTIKGEINRMCVTNELAELNTMTLHARNNIINLNNMIYERRFRDDR